MDFEGEEANQALNLYYSLRNKVEWKEKRF